LFDRAGSASIVAPFWSIRATFWHVFVPCCSQCWHYSDRFGPHVGIWLVVVGSCLVRGCFIFVCGLASAKHHRKSQKIATPPRSKRRHLPFRIFFVLLQHGLLWMIRVPC
jgi:hypothetical protein